MAEQRVAFLRHLVPPSVQVTRCPWLIGQFLLQLHSGCEDFSGMRPKYFSSAEQKNPELVPVKDAAAVMLHPLHVSCVS